MVAKSMAGRGWRRAGRDILQVDAANSRAAPAWLAGQLAWGDSELLALGAGCRGRLLAEVDTIDPSLRSQIWLTAYEAHYRDQLFSALTVNARHPRTWPQASAQVVMCMDDREEGTRRHLEEVAPDIQTFWCGRFLWGGDVLAGRG
jgi:uncharacterized protein